MTMKAIRIENATLISTTSGMPLAPVAARMRPFSSDMKPTTWLTALRRVTIISRPSSTTDSAKREVLARQRVGVRRHRQHHHHRQGHQADAGQHGRTDADHGLDLRWMPSRNTMRCSATGIMMALKPSAIAAVM